MSTNTVVTLESIGPLVLFLLFFGSLDEVSTRHWHCNIANCAPTCLYRHSFRWSNEPTLRFAINHTAAYYIVVVVPSRVAYNALRMIPNRRCI